MIVLSWIQIVLRLGAAALLGGLIGLERERTAGAPRAAGMRTLALVSMGSALFMLVSAYGFTDFTNAAYAKIDPTRIAAQVVSGIGFLGAGAILLRRNMVRGLTTAAAVWMVAGIGLACGIGFLLPALTATLLGLAVLEALRPIERALFPQRGDYPMTVVLAPGTQPSDVLAGLCAVLERNGLTLDTVELHPGRLGEELELRCRARTREGLVRAIGALRAQAGVQAVRAGLRGAESL
jgi:putative Mg2+ transporter-C (MgtC) family protein